MIKDKDTKLNKILNITNLIFVMFVSFLPLIISLVDLLFGKLVYIDVFIIFFVIAWIIFYSTYIIKFGLKIEIKRLFKNPIFCILLSIILWIILSSIFTNTCNSGLVVIAGYFMLGISVYLMKKEDRKIVINGLIIMISICVVMGLIDYKNEFMPGFLTDVYKYSMQFYNPNHAANAIAIIIGLVIGKIVNTEILWQKNLYILSYITLSLYMFLNGSFASIMAVFIGLIIYFIYKWSTSKKFPVDILLLFCTFCMISVLIDIVPFLRSRRFTDYGFFIECLAVFDSVFETNLCWFIGGASTVPGADGWTRNELWSMALQYISESPLFGKGIGFCRNELRPHNILLYLCVDFGIVVGLLFIALFVLVIVNTCKNKQKSSMSIAILIAGINYFIAGLFGNIKSQGFIYFVIVLAMIMKENKKPLSN